MVSCMKICDQNTTTKEDIVRRTDWQKLPRTLLKKRTLRHTRKISDAASDRKLHDRNESEAVTRVAAGREMNDVKEKC